MQAEPNMITLCRRVVGARQCEKHNWTCPAGKRRKTLIDATTASMVITIWDRLNEPNRAKLAAMLNTNPVRAVNMLWKVVR